MARYSKKISNYDRGFTLMEILVALTILALSFTVIMQLVSGSLRAQRLSGDYRQAVYLGEAKMEEILLAEKLAPGERQGDFSGDFSWKAVIAATDSAPQKKGELVPFEIDLEVSWQSGPDERRFTLSTIQLAEMKKSKDEK